MVVLNAPLFCISPTNQQIAQLLLCVLVKTAIDGTPPGAEISVPSVEI